MKPYDYEVEYLEIVENSGRTYIDTGYVPEGIDMTFNMTLQISGYNNYSVLFSNYSSSRKIYAITCLNLDDLRINYSSTDGSDYIIFNVNPYSIKDKLEIKLDLTNITVNDIGRKLNFNIADYKNNQPIWLFNNPILERQLYGKLYSFSIEKSGKKEIDLIPVSKDGIGYMYDRVTGQLFGAQGGGTFTVGPRI